jgi:DNA-directed RNA polymerase subunit beta
MPSLLDSKMTVHEPTALDTDHKLPQQAQDSHPTPPGTPKLLDMPSPLGAESPTAPPANPPRKKQPPTPMPMFPLPGPKLPKAEPVQQQTEPVKPQVPLAMRDFGDADALRSSIYKNVFDAASRMPSVSNTRYTLRLAEPHYADDENRSIAERKKAILTGQSLHRRLRGTWELVDTEGKVVDRKTTTVANIPHLTNQGTFVLGGTEYTLAHQMRLRPGIFTRIKENGEIESHINIMPGKGLSHRYFLEPSTGIFKISIGQANMPLYPVMKAMGINDEQLRESWGPELLAANMAKNDTRTMDKMYTRLIGKKADVNATAEQKREAVVKSLTSMEVDPEVTKRTLGQPFTHMDPQASLATTKKLLAVSRGEAETDDRDHLAFQNFLGPEDLFAERLGRDKRTLNELLWRATTRGNLERLPAGAFTKHVHDAVMESGLGQSLEEINPADVFDQQTRVSRLGYGGIPSIDAVPDEARNVQPSHLGYIDLLRTPESFKVGIDSRMSYTAKKGNDNRVYTPFIDPATGQQTLKSPQDVADSVVAFPGEMQGNKPMVAALVNGKTTYVPRNTVQLIMPYMEHAFSPINNLVPLKSTIKGQRASMASRFITQALPLKDAEAPYVRGKVPGRDTSFEDMYGKYMGAVHAKDMSGRVEKIEPDGITVQYEDGSTETHETYHNFPYNRKTYMHNTPQVKLGDAVQPGQLLASSNYTDAKGAVALGKNMRVAYIPFRGTNYEDAYVISEGAAKKFSSEHMYQHGVEWDELHKQGKRTYVSIFPGTFAKKVLDNMDEGGVVKPGTVVQPGDPIILAPRQREISRKQVHSAHKGSFADNSVTWDHHNEGVVTDVERTDKGVVVAVKSLNAAQVGDKISGRYGDKGVIGSIVPDDQMPHDEGGRPYEVLANPLGVISRTNAGQIVEAALGKLAEKTGKHYSVEDFDVNNPDVTGWAMKELEKGGMKGAENVHDPVTGRIIPGVMTGSRYFMKLHHTSESKGQGRGLGTYTSEGMPAKGGAEGSKRLALMDVNALLSHGAVETLRDAKLIRGQKNQEYWSSFMSGFKPPTPGVPLVYQKFVSQLKAAGINVTREGQQLHIMALTGKDVDEMAGDREIESGETVDWKSEMKPIKGGLFDERLTGGHNGNRWSKITLTEPMPNPVFEEPIRRVLGLTQKKFEAILSGKEKLGEETGSEAIHTALKNINIEQEIVHAREDIKSGRKTLRDHAIRRLSYLKAAEKQGIHPEEWMVDKVPVIPPMFRPVSVMQGTGGRLVADANYLYKEVLDANNNLKNLKPVTADVSDERLALYNSFKAVTGLGDPVQPKNQERKVKGMLAQIFGPSPKYSVVQQKLLGTTVDLVGRAVVVPNPDLNMDEVGLPEARAWEVYTPFIVRRLVRRGVPRLTALEYVRDRNNLARTALQEEVQERPVLVTRAPVLHRYGLMAFFPKLTKGDTLQIPPIVVGGFGMDFDGDASNYHVPASDEAKEEAINKLLPSKNLLSVAQFKPHYMPRQEYVGGLYAATNRVNSEKKHKTFATKGDAIRAYWRGELDPDQPIQVMHMDAKNIGEIRR